MGLFSPEPIGFEARSAAHALTRLLTERLRLPEGGRDVVILRHELGVDWESGRTERIRATLVEYGEAGGISAMARTVGMPSGFAARLLLDGRLPVVGCHRPTERAIYEPILAELALEGLEFKEETRP